MFKSLKNLLGLVGLLAFFGVWIGCSSDASPVSPSASKALTDDPSSPTPASTLVDIPDDSLRVAVTQAIWALPDVTIPTGSNPLTQANLAKVKVLKAIDKGIVNLSGLQHATNLDTLVLARNRIAVDGITDVTPLRNLTNLVFLDLQRTHRIRDVTPLANLTNLEVLHLNDNLITDVSSLKTLTKLKEFGIGSNSYDGEYLDTNSLITAINEMSNLEWLNVKNLGLADISFLAGLTKLEWLNLSANRHVRNFKPLACLPKLKTLHFRNMNMVAWSTGLDGELIASDDHIQYLLSIGVTIHR